MASARIIKLPVVEKTAAQPPEQPLRSLGKDVMDMPFEEVIRLVGGSAANGDNSDPVVLQGAALETVRVWIERYGFDRLPQTYGELMGMYDYCLELETLSGFDSVAPELRAQWQASSLRVQSKHDPANLVPLELYIAQNREGLRSHHRTHDTLTKLGKAYNEFDHEFED